ncbi:MAG: hypothetical protein SGILL_000578 [Bacillariaceae sp.]
MAASTDTSKYYADGTNREGVDPNPPLLWKSKDDLKNVEVHGPFFSHGTSKIRCFLMYHGIDFKHQTNPKEDPQGCKPGSLYRKVPIVDVNGRQVNDSGVILKYLAPAVGMDFDAAWENRIVYEIDTTFKLHVPAGDWARKAIATEKMPRILFYPIGWFLKNLESKQAHANIALGIGHKEGDTLHIFKQFSAERKGKTFHNGETVGHVDLSLYGFLSGYLFSKSKYVAKVLEDANLQDWVAAMQKELSLEKVFAEI